MRDYWTEWALFDIKMHSMYNLLVSVHKFKCCLFVISGFGSDKRTLSKLKPLRANMKELTGTLCNLTVSMYF